MKMNPRQLVQSKVSIIQYFEDHIDLNNDLKYTRKTLCPLHDEKTGSFTYFPDTDTFTCFGCGKSGSVIELHFHLIQRDDPEYTKEQAFEDLCKMYDIPLPTLFFEPLDLSGGSVSEQYKYRRLYSKIAGDYVNLVKSDILIAFGNSVEDVELMLFHPEKIKTSEDSSEEPREQ